MFILINVQISFRAVRYPDPKSLQLPAIQQQPPIGTHFMIMEFIDALPLFITDYKDKQWKGYIRRLLTRLCLQFRQLTHDQIESINLGNAGKCGLGSEP